MHTIIRGRTLEYIVLTPKPDRQLFLKDGTCYTFDVINTPSYDWPDTTTNLIEIEDLAFANGKWMLGSEPLAESLDDIQNNALVQLNADRAKKRLRPIALSAFADKVSESPVLHFNGQTKTEAAIVRRINLDFFTKNYVRRWRLLELLQVHDHDATLEAEVRAAAWFEGNDVPVLLRSFQQMAGNRQVVPDYFCSLADAAKYAAVTARTIQNWKSRGWLKVDQQGRKIRIARTELDKCKRQNKS